MDEQLQKIKQDFLQDLKTVKDNLQLEELEQKFFRVVLEK